MRIKKNREQEKENPEGVQNPGGRNKEYGNRETHRLAEETP